MKSEIYLTKQGLSEAQSELDHLVKVRRPEIAQFLKDAQPLARKLEPSEYDDIKHEQILVEKRIVELENLLKNATVIKDVNTNRVSIGTKIKLRFLLDNRVKTYSIVSTYEVDPLEDRISNESLFAKAILGKRVNDVATVFLRSSEFQIRILKISALL